MAYATLREVYQLALAAPAFVAYARPFDAVDAATATIRIKGHGLSTGALVAFEVSDGGWLPTGVTQFQTYAVTVINPDLFRLTGVSSWVDAGEAWGVTVDPTARLEAIAEERSAFIDEHLTAHEVPIQVDPNTGEYPQVLVGMCARLTARQAIASLAVVDPQYRVPVDRLLASEEDDKIILAAWKKGKPIQPRPADETPETPENAPIAAYSREEMPWQNARLSSL